VDRRSWAVVFAALSFVACQLIAELDDRTVTRIDASTDSAVDSTAADAQGCEMCGAMCVNLAKDAKNCGYCGHDCRGAPCTSGLCPALSVATFVNATAMAIDDANLYVSDQTGLHALPKGGGPTMNLAVACRALTTAAGHVFATTNYSVLDVSADGGALAQQIVFVRDGGGGTAANIDVKTDLPAVFWSTTKGLLAVDGGPNLEIIPEDAGVHPTSIGVDSSNVYFLAGYDLWKVDRDGGARALLNSSLAPGTRLAVTPEWIYWGDTQALRETSLGDAGSAILASDLVIADVVVHSNRLYWVVTGLSPNTGAIMTMSIAGGPAVPLARNVDTPGRLVVDESFVYWLENVSKPNSAVRKVAN
jgi:hypothetical protein